VPGTILVPGLAGAHDRGMRYESCVTSLSWIPSEAVTGLGRAVFDKGVTHYDNPPPAEFADIEELRAADRFRFANVLRAWIEVDDTGRITAGGYDGGGLSHVFQAAALPDLRREPERGQGCMRFVQTTGGRTGLPAPRRVRHRPFVQWRAPLVWTTLSLTLHADGRTEYAVEGASRFPRHWIYDADGRLARKSGLTDYAQWWGVSFGRHTPWGDEDSPALVTAVETALEQSLSVQLMRGAAKPRIRTVAKGDALVRQGEPGNEIFLILDGAIRVERDGEKLAEYGPGAQLEGGIRTSTLTAVTACRVASVPAGQFEPAVLAELAAGHRREDADDAVRS
jgi:hypothetical protein